MDILYLIGKIIIVFGVVNVWLFRCAKSTQYRGGTSTSLQDEFKVYGYPMWFFYLIGALKLIFSFFILLGFWFPSIVVSIGSFGMMILMIGAVFSHLKVKDSVKKYMPASVMLGLSVFVFLNSF